MAEPIFDAITERLYENLPEFYRTYDARQNWQLKKWLSGIGSVLNQVETLVERFDYTPPEEGEKNDTSELVDPMKADAAWLPWLAQLVGTQLDPTDSEARNRTRIKSALSGVRAGTKAAMIEAAKKVLTGSQTIWIYDHSTPLGIGTGGEWDVLILTVQNETLSSPVDAIIEAGAKPAGVQLHHQYYGASWDDLETQRPTWADWEAAPTWQKLEETGL